MKKRIQHQQLYRRQKGKSCSAYLKQNGVKRRVTRRISAVEYREHRVYYAADGETTMPILPVPPAIPP